MTKQLKPFFALLPPIGFFLYVCFYIIATFYYPGGSFLNKNSIGFQWDQNYWCELLAIRGKNAGLNMGRPYALTAMFFMVISLIVFWSLIPLLFNSARRWKKSISIAGIGSMLIIPFMLLGYHDTVINIAGSFGFTAILLTTILLFWEKLNGLAWLGVFSLLLCLLNLFSYYFNLYMEWLPYLQKFTFLVLIIWFSCLSLLLYQRLRNQLSGLGTSAPI